LGEQLITGANDNKVKFFNVDTCESNRIIGFESSLKSIDYYDGNLLVGLKNGTIVEVDSENN
jgi:WD40 repeat protein